MRRSKIVLVAAATLLGTAVPGTWAEASAVPGSNGKIAVAEPGPDEAGLVVTIDPDGTHRSVITAPGGLGLGDWSPDGSNLLVNLWAGSPLNQTRPATVTADGSDITLLDAYPDLRQGLFCSRWSPDGARLLCDSNDQVGDPPPPAAAGIYSVRAADGGDLTQVIATPDGLFDGAVAYSPDGSQILYLRVDPDDHKALYVADSDGLDQVRLTPPGLSVIVLDFFDSLQDWSPDGSRVTFAGRDLSRRGAPRALYVVNADGTGLRQIAPSGVGARSAQWSPNGRWIAFMSCCADPEVWLVHPNGSGLREVTTSHSGSQSWTPIWSPDGTRLLFQRIDRNGDVTLSTVSPDGTGLAEVTALPGLTAYNWGTAPTG
jgi:TolB protein